ncbi:MAG: TonB-dependent receptor [Pirellulaceae bacterium]
MEQLTARGRKSASLLSAVSLLLPGAVLAQSESGTRMELETIVVTAEKREASIDAVPIAIQAMTATKLESMTVNTLQDLPSYIPSLRADNPGNGAMTTFTLRGVGQRDVNPAFENNVAMFIDGAYIGFLAANGQPLFDLERVEVLKGPQGTLFGRNATGGLISVVTKKPSQEFDAYVTTQYGSHNETKLEGAIGGGLTDTVSARASVSYLKADGYLRNSTGPDLLENDSLSGRLQVFFEPSDSFNLLLSARAWEMFRSGGAGTAPTPYMLDANGNVVSPPSQNAYAAFCAGISAGVAIPPPGAWQNGSCYASQPNRYRGTYGDSSYFESSYRAITATAEWNLSDTLTVTSVTDYQHGKMDYSANITATTTPLFQYDLHTHPSQQFSEELRINGKTGAADWVTGLYFLNTTHDITTIVDLYNLPGLGLRLPADYKQKSKSYAAFAQVDYGLTDVLTLTLGGRLMYDRKSIHNDSTCTPNPVLAPIGPVTCDIFGQFVFPGGLAFNNTYGGRRRDTTWSGRAVLTYRPNENLTVYGGVNRGVKGGGFNAGGAEFYAADSVKFKPETLLSYEAGLKATLLESRLKIDGSVFYYDYKNFQAFSSTPGTGLLTVNVDSKITGAELFVTAVAAEGLTFSAGGTFLDTKQKNVLMPDGSLASFQMPAAPKWTLVGEARYGFPITGGDELAVQLNAIYSSSRSISTVDYASQRIPSFHRLDARATYTAAGGHWSISAFVNNLTDKYIVQNRIDFTTLSGNAVDIPDRPRWWGVSVTYRH